MALYVVEILPAALKRLRTVHPSYRALIRARIDTLESEARPPSSEALRGGQAKRWRLRVGDYRVVYKIDDKARRVTVLLVSHRRDVYRNL